METTKTCYYEYYDEHYDVVWFGPDCDVHPAINKRKTRPCAKIPYSRCFYPPEKSEDKVFVIYSSYLCQQGDETVFGPPSTYVDCFKKIMDFVSNEIDHLCIRKENKNPDGSSIIPCLECHKIVSYEK